MNARLTVIVPMIAATAAMALFTALGFWQLGRADFKRELAADYARQSGRGPAMVRSIADLSALRRFSPVTVSGRFDADRQIYLDNRIRDGRLGVHVFTPFELSGGGVVLVNRGWLALKSRQAPLPPAPAPTATVTLQGLVSPPPAVGIRLGDTPPATQWPWLTPYLAIGDAEAALGVELAGRVILLGESEPYGFARDWEPETLSPQRHLGYAFQWFAMAAAVAVIWIVLSWRSRGPRRDGRGGS